ncbi:methionine gamma-lyase family protein [Alicyclobacillus fastidiosus]|uniref:Methionine gamma-lyase family protein n=1 Tax=Alicyclobacillus fastidiosus TaxID=392011 RepID=A0ABV5AIR2_9BACL|nr:methionine gamma-lyase family protein [Alicyclobacillus fastidiosus]WEH07824.1 methionine gamma-lyase family protein [Alicyclobacillus fastidiosus]
MNHKIIDYIRRCEEQIAPMARQIQDIALVNQERVLEAFWTHRVAQTDLLGSTGYGLSDVGREKLEAAFADVFGAEAALVRPQIVSGTHALTLGFFGVLRPGEEIMFATGSPYDTLHGVVGLRPEKGSLAEWGVTSNVVDLAPDGSIDVPAVLDAISERTKLVMFQRSRGYGTREALSVDALDRAFTIIKQRHPNVLIGVDNCYGEFVESREPSHVGADLVMGSLIKNPGAGIAPTGGYIVGTTDVIEQVAARLVAPGTGAEYGPTGPYLQLFYQALFLAPHVVSQAVRGSVLFAEALRGLGYAVSPLPTTPRTDLILAVELGTKDKLLAFCRAVQSAAPIDAHVRPEADDMAGYEDEVVMAAGTFIQGASLELSADAPMRPPYTAYIQGGLTYEHAVVALKRVLQQLAPAELCGVE